MTPQPITKEKLDSFTNFARGDNPCEADLLTSVGPVFFPRFDLIEAPDRYTLLADLPGFEGEDVDLELTDRYLTVAGERELEATADGNCYHALERASGAFSRTFHLAVGVLWERREVIMHNGVLRINLPKGIAPATGTARAASH